MNKKTHSPTKKFKVLVLGHPLVVDVNRSVWNSLGENNDFEVDLVVPKKWKSNLIKELGYSPNQDTDQHINSIYTPKAFFKGNGSLTFFNPLSLFFILNKRKYNHIILTQETWSISLLVLTITTLLTRNFTTKIDIWVCQNLKKEHLKWLIPFERVNCLKVDKILCCCSEIEEVISWKNIKRSCYYFPFSFSAAQYHQIKPIESFSKPLKLGYIGRLSDEKGMQLIIDLTKRLEESNIDFELHMAGSGPWSEKWSTLAKNNASIHFHGVLKHTEAYHFYERVHAILLPSLTRSFWKEQFGRVIIEAAASGRAVIGSNSGAIPEVMSEIQMPFNFEEGSIESFYSMTRLCLKQFEDKSIFKVLENSKRLTFEKYDHKSVAKRARVYLTNPKDSFGLIKNSKLS